VIALRGVSKAFAGVAALDNVSLTFAAGAVHGLLGENGAGKSTLMQVLFGLQRPDTGSIAVNDQTLVLRSPRAARQAGIGMVHQHFSLVPTLSVLDNLALAVQDGIGPVPRTFLRTQLAALTTSLGWTIDPDALVGELAVGVRQRVEIVKALTGGSRVLILDEPTAVLTPQEVDELLPALTRLAAAGRTIILITHKLHEVERVCDTVSILRRGRLVHSGPRHDITRERMAELMVGTALHARAPRPVAVVSDAVLTVQNVCLRRDDGAPLMQEVSFQVRRGEIVGIAGVDGNGQSELVAAVLGLRPIASGTVVRDGGLVRPGFIAGDRHRFGLIGSRSLRDNLLLVEGRAAPYARSGWLQMQRWAERARELIAAYDVRSTSIDQPAASLSGGNQQKLVAARELARQPALIIAENPTRGLDLAASAAIMGRLEEARARHAGILLVHSDLDELLAVSDRVLVASGGRLLDSGWPENDRSSIGNLMLGLPVVHPS